VVLPGQQEEKKKTFPLLKAVFLTERLQVLLLQFPFVMKIQSQKIMNL